MADVRPLPQQLDRLVELGLPELSGRSAAAFRDLAAALPDRPDVVVAVHPDLVPASRLAPLLSRGGKAGFVVEDLTDLEDFGPIAGLEIPDQPLYLVAGINVVPARSASWSPFTRSSSRNHSSLRTAVFVR